MTANEIRQKFLDFFKEKGHAIVPSASLIPEDKTVLFITAGMQPLVPHLMGELAHPRGSRLANSQKCLRTDDILEVGDNRHLTFFEMLGNWSIGDYFKKEAIEWSFELLTSKKWFGIPPEKLFVSVFEGDKEMGIGLDGEAVEIWKKVFAGAGLRVDLGDRIYAYPKKKNWWELAGPGPCGPDTEIFYDTHPNSPLENHGGQAGEFSQFGPTCHVNCDCGRYIEIWNNVFMEYEKKVSSDGKVTYSPLAQKNVDTGMGFERLVMVLHGKDNIFETDLFQVPFQGLFGGIEQENYRIIADHLRACVFLIADGVRPANKGAGYILRRLVRRAMVSARTITLPIESFDKFISNVIAFYSEAYPDLDKGRESILAVFTGEKIKFNKTLESGLKEFFKKYPELEATYYVEGKPIPVHRPAMISGEDIFYFHQTYGLTLDIIKDLAKRGLHDIDEIGFNKEFAKHQEISRAGAEKKFGGHGLILNTGELKAANEEELKKV